MGSGSGSRTSCFQERKLAAIQGSDPLAPSLVARALYKPCSYPHLHPHPGSDSPTPSECGNFSSCHREVRNHRVEIITDQVGVTGFLITAGRLNSWIGVRACPGRTRVKFPRPHPTGTGLAGREQRKVPFERSGKGGVLTGNLNLWIWVSVCSRSSRGQ